jgi:hypothetical protein
MQSLSEYTKLWVVNDMLRSFDLENNNEHLEQPEDNPFDYCMATKLLEALIIQQCRQHHVNFWLAKIWSTILPSEQNGIKYKNENRILSIIPIKKEKENKIRIPHEYKVGDQVLLETPGILRKLSTSRTGPYPVTNAYKNGKIRIQKAKRNCIRKSEYL